MAKRFFVLLIALSFCFAYSGIAMAGARIVIDKSTNQLQFYQDELLQRTFPVATGRTLALTPEGNFSVVIKLVNPYYSRLNIPGGSPNNPLGYRWLGLSVGGGGIYGIHGTNNPSSIGTYASSGCIRMYNQDALWLYEHTPVGTPVKITGNSPAMIAAQPKPLPVKVLIETYTIEVKEPAGINAEGVPLLPMRPIFEKLGYTIGWNNTSRSLVITKGTEQISVAYDSGLVTAGQYVFTCPELKLVQGTAHAPLSFWQQALPLMMQVSWDPEQRQITFREQLVPEYRNQAVTAALPTLQAAPN